MITFEDAISRACLIRSTLTSGMFKLRVVSKQRGDSKHLLSAALSDLPNRHAVRLSEQHAASPNVIVMNELLRQQSSMSSNLDASFASHTRRRTMRGRSEKTSPIAVSKETDWWPSSVLLLLSIGCVPTLSLQLSSAPTHTLSSSCLSAFFCDASARLRQNRCMLMRTGQA